LVLGALGPFTAAQMFADAVKLTSCGVPAAKHGNKNKKNNTHILFTLRFVRSDVGNKLSKRQKVQKWHNKDTTKISL
jgi:hypothetical protein